VCPDINTANPSNLPTSQHMLLLLLLLLMMMMMMAVACYLSLIHMCAEVMLITQNKQLHLMPSIYCILASTAAAWHKLCHLALISKYAERNNIAGYCILASIAAACAASALCAPDGSLAVTPDMHVNTSAAAAADVLNAAAASASAWMSVSSCRSVSRHLRRNCREVTQQHMTHSSSRTHANT
jgi:hypothetical protein